MMEWMQHHQWSCPNEQTTCVMCALHRTFCQMLDGTICSNSAVPELAGKRRQVSEDFAHGQHDVVEFFQMFLERVREGEEQAFRCAPWYGVEGMHNVTQ